MIGELRGLADGDIPGNVSFSRRGEVCDPRNAVTVYFENQRPRCESWRVEFSHQMVRGGLQSTGKAGKLWG